jgi:hypothetical protein
MTTGERSREGCYGFALTGLDQIADLLVKAPPAWKDLLVECHQAASPPPVQDSIGPRSARLPMFSGGWVDLDRDAGRIAFHLPQRPPDGDLVHPYLAPAAAVAARWAGYESFHAGAVVAGGGAWGILGDKESGKSSTLAYLALSGREVLMDDLVVVDGDDALAGRVFFFFFF